MCMLINCFLHSSTLLEITSEIVSIKTIIIPQTVLGECGGLVVNASDSGSRGRGLESHSGQTVLCP